ncbi:MAG: hypothetical protein A3K60_06950 [Euryarchaeota archaeon RBG_19FT_COMBO_56_21]|nr:MAG: hypothetical protein A3K60_06950 [Euryarchaeota archaeon RBG_19FT_COMBO_56_21]
MRALAAPALVLLALVLSQGTASAEYPTLVYYVTDQVGVLTSSEEFDIQSVCVEVYEQTGAEIAVLVVNTTLPDGIDMFAVKTFEQNGLGQEGEDDGLLILVSVEENAWRIEVGYGLEGILPDSKVGDIVTANLVPYLAVSDYYSGLYYTTYAVGLEIVTNYSGTPHTSESQYPIPWIPLKTWQLAVVIGAIVVLGVLTKGRAFLLWMLFSRNWGGGGKNWGGGRSGGGGARGRW